MNSRIIRDLAGEWRFACDPTRQSINLCGGWYDYELPERVILPGTTASNNKGVPSTVKDVDHMSSAYQYVGPAWYQRDIEIPEEWRDKRFVLFLERTARTRVWIDSSFAGSSDRLQTPQRYDLGRLLYPGKHTISIEVDNEVRRPVQYAAHLTNGITGRLRLEVMDRIFIDDIRIRTDYALKRAFVDVTIGNESGLQAGGRFLSLTTSDGFPDIEKWVEFRLEAGEKRKVISYEIDLRNCLAMWDEFSPNLYHVRLSLYAKTPAEAEFSFFDSAEAGFGVRDFRTKDMHFVINGRTVFLRGDLAHEDRYSKEKDDLAMWKKLMLTYKEYGLNHLRFHTSCPTEAAFKAADELGLYLQVELPIWTEIASPEDPEYEPMLEPMMKRQGEYLLREYGNHPSFCMMTLGNEHSGYRPTLEHVVAHLRSFDPTRLYAEGSNNFLEKPVQSVADDFWVTFKTHEGYYQVRGSCSHSDAPIGPVQSEAPGTQTDFTAAAAFSTIPVLGHEIGQYETSPNFDEIDKFPKEIIPGNLLLFKETMEKQGLLPRWRDFYRATGRLALDCYRQDIEMFTRTANMAGYQILGIRDALGQGSALVGILNVFGESKGMVTPEEWRRYCGPEVLLIRMDKYVYRSGEHFAAKVQMANYGRDNFPDAGVSVLLCGVPDGKEIFSTVLKCAEIPQGGLFDVGGISVDLPGFSAPEPLLLTLKLEGTDIINEYKIWVFPEAAGTEAPEGVHVTSSFDAETEDILSRGGRVVLFPKRLHPDHFVEGYYCANFWSYQMFRNLSLQQGKTVMPGTLGMYIDKESPVFGDFPAEDCSEWHWWHIEENSSPIILDDFPAEIAPAVQVVDNPMRCHKLGLIFEAKVGGGSLLVCAARLDECGGDPAAAWLKQNILRYAASERFAPAAGVDAEKIRGLFME